LNKHEPHERPTPNPEINIKSPSDMADVLDASFKAIGILDETVFPIYLEL